MYINTKGLVLREATYKETSKILTVLTSDVGKVTVLARGVRRRGSKTAAGTQLLAFSDMTLYEGRGRYTLTEAQSIELFEGLRNDVEKLALGSYFAEVLETVSDEDMPNPEILALGLNALFSLSEDKYPAQNIKAAFELRIMCLAGFAPALGCCAECGAAEPNNPVIDISGGTVLCARCARASGVRTENLCSGSLAAMRHIAGCEQKRVFSFRLGSDSALRLGKVTEKYLEEQLDRGFRTLDFYKSVKQI